MKKKKNYSFDLAPGYINFMRRVSKDFEANIANQNSAIKLLNKEDFGNIIKGKLRTTDEGDDSIFFIKNRASAIALVFDPLKLDTIGIGFINFILPDDRFDILININNLSALVTVETCLLWLEDGELTHWAIERKNERSE